MIQNPIIAVGPNLARYTLLRVNIGELNSYFLAPVAGPPGTTYTVGTIHVLGESTWSAAVITPVVSNFEPRFGGFALHPSGSALTAPTAPLSRVTPGLALDYGWFGFYVSTAESSATYVDVVIEMHP